MNKVVAALAGALGSAGDAELGALRKALEALGPGDALAPDTQRLLGVMLAWSSPDEDDYVEFVFNAVIS